jgi:hypothetical protein
VSDVSAAVRGVDIAADSRSQPTYETTARTTPAVQTNISKSGVDPVFCHVFAGSFSKWQGLEMESGMGRSSNSGSKTAQHSQS